MLYTAVSDSDSEVETHCPRCEKDADVQALQKEAAEQALQKEAEKESAEFALALQALKERGVTVDLSGCGCCDDNYAWISIDGKPVIQVYRSFHIDSDEVQ